MGSRRLTGKIAPVAILHPFPDIAMNIVQPKPIGLERPHRTRAIVGAIPKVGAIAHVLIAYRLLIAPGILRGGPRPRRILPLGLAGEPITARPSVDEADERARVRLPTHIYHRASAAAKFAVLPLLAHPGADARAPLVPCRFKPGDGEARNPHAHLRAFVAVAPSLARRAAHSEATRRDHHHLRAAVALPEERKIREGGGVRHQGGCDIGRSGAGIGAGWGYASGWRRPSPQIKPAASPGGRHARFHDSSAEPSEHLGLAD
jgi:hypothetical protein